MSIIDERRSYQPFEYPRAYEFWETQQEAHWMHTDAKLSSSVVDWTGNLTEKEKAVVSGILQGFTQAEILIGKYWGQRVAKWFPKPEIGMMCATFASFESLHIKSYNYLIETLDMQEFDSFLAEDDTSAKLGYLLSVKDDNLSDIARSLAIYSAFTEGVSLFSSFAVLLSFSMRNLLKGVGDLISYSIRDEDLHSLGGIWLYNQLVTEYPELLTPEFKESIYEGARETVRLEIKFISKAFALGDIEGITLADLVEFIKDRANSKLEAINLESIFDADSKKANNIKSWFEPLVGGASRGDFFNGAITEYSKSFNKDSIKWELVHHG